MAIGRGLVGRVWEWIRERAGLDRLPFFRVPYNYMSLSFWLGAIVAASFMLLAITGLLLLFYYDPGDPVGSNKELIENKPFGRFLLTTHLYAAHAMLLSAIVHMFRNFIVGAYKKPRELVWIVGVITGFIALQAAFFGYSLLGDRIAQEAIAIGTGLVEQSLGIMVKIGDTTVELGKFLVALAFDVDEEARYYRLLALHIIMATLLFLLFALHFGLFEQHGPQPSHEETGWKTEPERISQDRPDLAPWFPVNFMYILVITLGIWGVIVLASAASQAAGFVHQLLYPLPIYEGTEVAELARPMPPWFLVYAFKLFQLDFLYVDIPGMSAILVFLISLVLPPLVLILIPFLDRSKSTHPLDRPKTIIMGGLLLIYFWQLTVWGALGLGYHSKWFTAAIFLVPLLIVSSGVYLMRSVRSGSGASPVLGLTLIATVIVAFILPLLPRLFGQRAVSWPDAATLFLGTALSIGYLGLLASMTLGGGKSSEKKLAGGSGAPSEIPLSVLVLAIIELAIVIYSGTFLATAVDPVSQPALSSALAGLMLLAVAGLLHIVYRVVVSDKIPLHGLSSFKSHALLVIALLVVAAAA
ncbi:MAG: cytochrome b N-terminal domain-containing protein [Desulfurococcales archaeon]|nr:cytochrome b N-terminal domain-containing protein [Desulfurococcales archaeon]